jgi:hypothetical protein
VRTTTGAHHLAYRTDFTGAGTAVTTGFDLSGLLNGYARARALGRVITAARNLGGYEMTVSNAPGCKWHGIDAPQIAGGGFGFDPAAASPNPFSQSISIRFSVPSLTHVRIDVYNILARRGRRLVDEPLEADGIETFPARGHSRRRGAGVFRPSGDSCRHSPAIGSEAEDGRAELDGDSDRKRCHPTSVPNLGIREYSGFLGRERSWCSREEPLTHHRE